MTAMILTDDVRKALTHCLAFDLNDWGCATSVIAMGGIDEFTIDDCIEECQHPDARHTDDEITVDFLKALLKLDESTRNQIIEQGIQIGTSPCSPDDVLARPWRKSVIAHFLSA